MNCSIWLEQTSQNIKLGLVMIMIERNDFSIREAFKKKQPNIWKFPYVGGRGGLEGVHFHMFSQLFQNDF